MNRRRREWRCRENIYKGQTGLPETFRTSDVSHSPEVSRVFQGEVSEENPTWSGDERKGLHEWKTNRNGLRGVREGGDSWVFWRSDVVTTIFNWVVVRYKRFIIK